MVICDRGKGPATPIHSRETPRVSFAPRRPTRSDHVLRVPLLLLAAGAAAAWALDGPPAAAALVSLAVYEIALSVDNAVPMAGVAGRLHPGTRRAFLAVGLVAGVLVMRLVVPPLAVSAAATQPADETAAAITAFLD